MATNKKEATKKPATPVVKDEENRRTVKLADGTEHILKNGDVLKKNADGTFEIVTPELITKAKGMFISVCITEDDDNIVKTFMVEVTKCDNGNLVFTIGTANGMTSFDKDMKEEKECAADSIRLLGRGANMEAMFAADACFRAYTMNLGLEKSYALVRLELERGEKKWMALFAPVLSVLD